MSKKIYKFVEGARGEFEGNQYNNITLSDGLRAVKFKNRTKQIDVIDVLNLKEGDEVVPEFDIVFAKDKGGDFARVDLVGLTRPK